MDEASSLVGLHLRGLRKKDYQMILCIVNEPRDKVGINVEWPNRQDREIRPKQETLGRVGEREKKK